MPFYSECRKTGNGNHAAVTAGHLHLARTVGLTENCSGSRVNDVGVAVRLAVIGERSVVTDVKVNGKSKERTVYLDEKNNSLIRPYYMLSVKLNDKGYPSYDSLCKSVIDFIDNTPELNKVLP